jgi:DNA modification methylase
MNFLHTEIGSAKDNQKSPVHNWYKFTAGFSYKFVEEIIKLEGLKRRKSAEIFDPFAGCGTTLVSSQKEGIKAVGNESQEFMYDIIKAKLNWSIEIDPCQIYLEYLKVVVKENSRSFSVADQAHPLLVSLYEVNILKELYLLKFAIEEIKSEKYKLFFKLALSQTLHKVSIHPIAIPYIVRTKTLSNEKTGLEVFLSICELMLGHTQGLADKSLTSKIYRQDSRKSNRYIDDRQCNICITSPPYLNNLDYGEISKVHTHFFEITNSWSDITKTVRKNLVTGATTHYTESEFDLDVFSNSNFAIENKNILNQLLNKSKSIKASAKEKSGKKSFDILMLLYFKDMHQVLSEMKRVLKRNGKAYLILGDSAPYGIHIPTTKLIGKIAKNIGYDEFKIHKIRSRGTKWKTLKHRHNLELTENVLVVK